jgi:predicted DNA-binding WGR domain protein
METYHMEMSRISFASFLFTAFDKGDYSTDDAIAFVLPLFRKVLGFHEAGLVAPFEKEEALFVSGGGAGGVMGGGTAWVTAGMARDVMGGVADIDESLAHAPAGALYRVNAPDPAAADRQPGQEGQSDYAWQPGYGCFEQQAGHHDPQTDIFCLGLVLGSIAMGLDLYNKEDLSVFVRNRSNPCYHYPRIHPTLSRLITDMTEPERGCREPDLYEVIRRLEHYRDYNAEDQTDLSTVAGWMHKDLKQRDAYILNKLRNRLFDTSRRNRLLYYKPNSRFVNLTIGSVPLVLYNRSVRPELLFTWNTELAEKITGMKEILLNKYLRFEDHDYLASSLNGVRVTAQRDIQEYGFSQLKLVIAFLDWYNLKEEPAERIRTPLLLLPAEIKKNKKVKEDHFVLKVSDNAAEVNPVLAGMLATLYGIRLPEFIDLDEMSPGQFYSHVQAQIEAAGQGIVLRYLDKPDIPRLCDEARQTVGQVRKKQRRPLGLRDEAEGQGDAAEGQEKVPADPGLKVLGLYSGAWRGPRPPLTGLDNRGKAVESPVPGVREQEQREAPVPGVAGEPVRGVAGEPDAPVVSDPHTWDFDVCHMVLGNFHYKKMSLVRDYNVVMDQQMQHDVFDELFSEQPRIFPEQAFDGNRPDDWYHVITADPTQTRAILQSRAGYSYIIQGPPGTGKSQTITNLIADFVARGSSILFVCEKRAALDVVYHRLKQVGLEELCCYIHDSQGDKREFIKNLKATYEDFAQNKMDLPLLKARRQSLLDKMNVHLDFIREFHETSNSIVGGVGDAEGAGDAGGPGSVGGAGGIVGGGSTGITVRSLIERLLNLRQALPVLNPQDEEILPSYREWQVAAPALAELAVVLEETGADPVFALHPFSRVREDIFFSANPQRALTEALQQALAALEEVNALLAASPVELTGVRGSGGVGGPGRVRESERLRNLVQFAVLLYPLARTNQLALADPASPEALEFERRLTHCRGLQEAHRHTQEATRHWTSKLEEQELATALALANRYEGSFFGGLNGAWQKCKKQLQQRYDFSAHKIKPSYSSLLEGLKTEYAAAALVSQCRHALQSAYHLDNIDASWRSIDLLQSKKGHPELDYLLRHPDNLNLVASLQALHQPLSRLESQVQRCLQDPPTGDLSALKDELLTIQMNVDTLGDWLAALRTFSATPAAVKKSLRQLPLRIVQLEAAAARKALQEIYQHNRTFSGADFQTLDKAVRQVGEGYAALQDINADIIRAFIRQRFLQRLDLSNRAASQLNEEQKKFKKIYTEGRKILENEFGKSMRYKSIRELSAKESGTVLKDIKPVWLMSPYSVSDSLPLDYDHFDVVIFDEASQITLEEGVPALYRARQAIIVGDEKQMPPSDFFGAGGNAGGKDNDPDDLDKGEGLPEDEWLSDDADSLLVQGARKLVSTLLSWHYRSHFETLISYSNHAFYEGNLLTIPDKTIHHREKAPIRIAGGGEGGGGTAGEAAVQVASLFDRSISFHLLTDSVYEKRSNAAEAAYIANLVRELLHRGVRESIGIVAFSQEQQHAIEAALDGLAAADAGFAQLLEDAFNRTENDQFVGLIIKNLENIQGDERDIIIMSVCYGFDSRRRMLMNFGPVNKRGGEKRLNVLFSRARMHMAVVSSIRYEHITNVYNDGANYLRRFLQYAELISEGRMASARSILDSLAPPKAAGADAIPTIIRTQIKEQLLAFGYEVAEEIGQSDFKCAMAVKRRPEDAEYSLAILIDDERHYSNGNLIEQYSQRPAILERFGWKLLPVYAKDWLHQPQKVMEQVLKALGAGPVDGMGRSGGAGVGVTPGGAAGTGIAPTGGPGAYDHLDFRRLVIRDESGEKFWEAATDGNKLIVRLGKTGARGQIQMRTFADEETARNELGRILKEKSGDGYQPAQEPR